MSRTISEITRADLLDWFIAAEVKWWGRLDEHQFLGRLYDLDSLPSTDSNIASRLPGLLDLAPASGRLRVKRRR
jgi:hypothetical protein